MRLNGGSVLHNLVSTVLRNASTEARARFDVAERTAPTQASVSLSNIEWMKQAQHQTKELPGLVRLEIQAMPKNARMLADVFASLPSHEFPQEIAEKQCVPKEMSQVSFLRGDQGVDN
ncbi:hypothetical protein BC567DRAFT_207372 [Phyllosticta citribraziliensis]